MNTAETIRQIHIDRDKELFDHIVAEIMPKLADREWLLDHRNYNRYDDGEITYSFRVSDIIASVIGPSERTYASTQLNNLIYGHFNELGFVARITSVNELTLKTPPMASIDEDIDDAA
ncbi:hypothetical protein ST201phi2-1p189 [Pseudomonas phage 201phi2-1]|uniref:Uncharacterized protein n=1 Tax=Pseudomonas phage 201phi2-1 TaxID=198110 RepID=B3FJ52_BP201|nr:hypothetical protein ST201phi2-1p189 [Pseudomonas phage 201phi2-1]ABY63019.1 hypothetical protein 201phi2-1p189 [Pseudomonas phage 201phi2-1]